MSEEATAIKKQAGDPQRQSGGCIQSLLQVAQIDTEGGRNQTHFQPLGKLFGHPKCHVNELISAQEISVCDDDSVEPSCECLGSRLCSWPDQDSFHAASERESRRLAKKHTQTLRQ